MIRWLKKIVVKLVVAKELFSFLWQNRLWWMIPMVVAFILLGILIWFAQSSAVVPFVYTLF